MKKLILFLAINLITSYGLNLYSSGNESVKSEMQARLTRLKRQISAIRNNIKNLETTLQTYERLGDNLSDEKLEQIDKLKTAVENLVLSAPPAFTESKH